MKCINLILLSGGLGNQMFQYALAMALSKMGKDVYVNGFIADYENDHNGMELHDVFNIDTSNGFLTNLFVKFIYKFVVKYRKYSSLMSVIGVECLFDVDNNFDWIKSCYNLKLFNIWFGRFQSELFFLNCKDEILRTFQFDGKKVSCDTRNVVDNIMRNESVSIHIRKGDYMDRKNYDLYANICTDKYYQYCVSIVNDKIDNPIFFVFSDDKKWVLENLELPINTVFVDWNVGRESWKDMYLMSICKHNIIANSTFSWWAAYLNKNPNKLVLCPRKYTNVDISDCFYHKEWIKVSSF